MSLSARYMGQSTRGPSGRIWDRMDWDLMSRDPREGILYYEEFLSAPSLATTTEDNGLYAFLDTSATAKGVATDDADGVMVLETAGTDNNAAALTIADNVAAPFRINTSTKADVAFEARIKLSSVADYALFVGLAEEGLAANDSLADNTGAVGDKDFVGFRVLTATPTELDAFYKKEGQTEVEVEGATATLAAATWVKVGFRYDYLNDTMRYYVDNTEVCTQTDVSGTEFPSGEGLVPLIYLKTGEGVTKTVSIDWWAVGQHKAS